MIPAATAHRPAPTHHPITGIVEQAPANLNVVIAAAAAWLAVNTYAAPINGTAASLYYNSDINYE